MWWLLAVGAVVASLIFCVLYLEFGRGTGKKRYDRTADTSTNYMLLQQQANSNRNQNSGSF